MKRVLTLLLINLLWLSGPVYSMDKCAALLAGGAFSDLVGNYDLRYQIASQTNESLNNSDDACGNVCGVNLGQGLSVAVGGTPIADPVAYLNRIFLDPQWRGGLNQVKLNKFLSLVIPEITGRNVSLNSVRWESKAALENEVVLKPVISIADLQVGPRSGQVVSLLPYTPAGGFKKSAHWVLLSKLDIVNGQTLVISDPNFPRVEVEMRIDNVTVDSEDGKMMTLGLIPKHPSMKDLYERQYGRGVVFVVKAITTASVQYK